MSLPAGDVLRREFDTHGYLVLPGFVDRDHCEALRARARSLVERALPGAGLSVFSTRSHAHASDAYFAGSGDQVRLFFEPDSVGEDGELLRSPWECLNKIGHAMHDLDPLFDQFSRTPGIQALSAALGIERAHLVQSMYLCKQPELGSAVDWHQDASFLITDPPSVIGFWFALEDASIDNGCLYALRGGHREPARKRFSRRDGTLRLETVVATPFDTASAVPLEAEAGTLIVLHGQLPHASGPNHSVRSREAYALHLVDADAAWAPDNWIRRAADRPFRGFSIDSPTNS